MQQLQNRQSPQKAEKKSRRKIQPVEVGNSRTRKPMLQAFPSSEPAKCGLLENVERNRKGKAHKPVDRNQMQKSNLSTKRSQNQDAQQQ